MLNRTAPVFDKRGGSLKIVDQLQKRDDLESACRNTVAAAMREIRATPISKLYGPWVLRVQ